MDVMAQFSDKLVEEQQNKNINFVKSNLQAVDNVQEVEHLKSNGLDAFTIKFKSSLSTMPAKKLDMMLETADRSVSVDPKAYTYTITGKPEELVTAIRGYKARNTSNADKIKTAADVVSVQHRG